MTSTPHTGSKEVIQLSIDATDEKIEVGRVIGDVGDPNEGPTVVVIGGMHGNEHSGVFALHKIFEILEKDQLKTKGRLIGLVGNLKALEQRKRFLSRDLNRLWTVDNMLRLVQNKLNGTADDPEIKEQVILYERIRNIINSSNGPFYFIDLHTTSAESMPFVVINDTLSNRTFALDMPTHVIIGIEEFIDGPLLSFMNEVGHVSIGFEAGQHDELSSIENAYDLVWNAMHVTGLLDLELAPRGKEHYTRLKRSMEGEQMIFEVRERFEVQPKSSFTMKPGFINFQKIHKGELLAECDGKELLAKENGRVFMPLYQTQGVDGYFLIGKVSKFWLGLSSVLRKTRSERILRLLPGVRKMDKDSHTLVVDRRVAAFLATEIFHILGYRRKKVAGTKMFFIRRSINHPELLSKN